MAQRASPCLSGVRPSFPAPRSNALIAAQERPRPRFPSPAPRPREDSRAPTCAESMTATIIFSSSPLRKVSSGNWRGEGGWARAGAQPVLAPHVLRGLGRLDRAQGRGPAVLKLGSWPVKSRAVTGEHSTAGAVTCEGSRGPRQGQSWGPKGLDVTMRPVWVR